MYSSKFTTGLKSKRQGCFRSTLRIMAHFQKSGYIYVLVGKNFKLSLKVERLKKPFFNRCIHSKS